MIMSAASSLLLSHNLCSNMTNTHIACLMRNKTIYSDTISNNRMEMNCGKTVPCHAEMLSIKKYKLQE